MRSDRLKCLNVQICCGKVRIGSPTGEGFGLWISLLRVRSVLKERQGKLRVEDLKYGLVASYCTNTRRL